MPMVDVSTPDGAVPLYVSRPEAAPTAAMIVLQEAFGLTDHIKDVADRAAAAGYLSGRACAVPPLRLAGHRLRGHGRGQGLCS